MLKSIGALDEDCRVTDLGHALSRISVDPPIACMLLKGIALGCLDPLLTAAAALSHKDPFVVVINLRDKVHRVEER